MFNAVRNRPVITTDKYSIMMSHFVEWPEELHYHLVTSKVTPEIIKAVRADIAHGMVSLKELFGVDTIYTMYESNDPNRRIGAMLGFSLHEVFVLDNIEYVKYSRKNIGE